MESASGSEFGDEEDNDFMRGGVRKRGPRGGKHMTVSILSLLFIRYWYH